MYLEFALDIIKAGDTVIVTCENDVIEGVVVKISKQFIAVQQSDGSIIVKNDNDITDIKANNKKSTKVPVVNVNNNELEKSKARCGMILIKKDKTESFHCSICGKDKISKKYAVEINNPDIRICNSCYGWTLSRLENQ